MDNYEAWESTVGTQREGPVTLLIMMYKFHIADGGEPIQLVEELKKEVEATGATVQLLQIAK